MRLFSEEWATALTAALNDDGVFRSAASGRSDVIAYRVSGTDAGDLVYSLVLDDGKALVSLGEPSRKPDLTITLDAETALKISQGRLKGQQASITGRVQLNIPLPAMVAFGSLLDTRQQVEANLPIEA